MLSKIEHYKRENVPGMAGLIQILLPDETHSLKAIRRATKHLLESGYIPVFLEEQTNAKKEKVFVGATIDIGKVTEILDKK